MAYVAYMVSWISTSFGVCAGLYFTHSAWCLLAFFIPAKLSVRKKWSENEEDDVKEDGQGEKVKFTNMRPVCRECGCDLKIWNGETYGYYDFCPECGGAVDWRK